MMVEYGQIIKYKNKLGRVVTALNSKQFKFKDCNIKGMISYSTLPSIELKYVKEPTIDEIDKVLSEETSVWGRIIQVHRIGEYQFVEYIGKDNKTHYSIFINNDRTSNSSTTLDQAIITAISIKYDGVNTKADVYFSKMLGWNIEAEIEKYKDSIGE